MIKTNTLRHHPNYKDSFPSGPSDSHEHHCPPNNRLKRLLKHCTQIPPIPPPVCLGKVETASVRVQEALEG